MREALGESGDDRLDNYMCQLWTILSQLKRAKNDEIPEFLLNLEECNRLDQIGTHGAKEEKGHMANFQRDLATWHQQNLEGMLANSVQKVRKLSELFDGQKTEWESELAFRLRKIAVSDTEQWDFRVKLATQRMFELVDGRPDLFNLLDWMLRLYIELFFSESDLAKRKTMLSLNMLIYIKSVNVLIGQKRGRRECGWTSFRKELAKSFDSIQLIESEHHFVSAELETMSYLVLLHRLEKELEQLSELSEGWTVFNFLNKPRKNGEERMEAIVEEVRLQLERKNAELIESFVDTKKEFRKTFQAEEERGRMTQIMSEMRWDEITIFKLKWKRSAGKKPFAAIARCDGMQAMEMYWQELMESPNAELVHSLTLFRLLKRFKGFSHFLCQKMRNNTVDTKDRLLLLIHSNSEFEWLEKQFPLILRIVFNKEMPLSDHYLLVFFMAQSEFDRMINKLAADLIIFVQWIDSEPKGFKMEKFWEKKRALEMERTYDRLFDIEPGFELEKTSLAFEELFKGLKNFLETNRNVGIEKKLLEEWDKKVKRVEKEAQQRNDEMGESVGHKMPKWLLEMHGAKFKKWIKNNDFGKGAKFTEERLFVEELKKGL
uniref:RING-type domain-containing protein n=1 Tax=Globodera pallida TaxID=36090 RepID=A0A183BI40_GLOPA